MAMHHKLVCFVGPMTMQLHLFSLLHEHRKDLKNGGQPTWVDMIFIDRDICYLLFSYILSLGFPQNATIVVYMHIIFLNYNRVMI